MSELIKKLCKLVDVKTIVTFAVVGVFCFLSATGRIETDAFMQIVTLIIGFFFASKTFGKDESTK